MAFTRKLRTMPLPQPLMAIQSGCFDFTLQLLRWAKLSRALTRGAVTEDWKRTEREGWFPALLSNEITAWHFTRRHSHMAGYNEGSQGTRVDSWEEISDTWESSRMPLNSACKKPRGAVQWREAEARCVPSDSLLRQECLPVASLTTSTAERHFKKRSRQ